MSGNAAVRPGAGFHGHRAAKRPADRERRELDAELADAVASAVDGEPPLVVALTPAGVVIESDETVVFDFVVD